jgi:hypothetical protein
MKSLNIYQKLTLGFFVLLVFFWGGLFFSHTSSGNLNYWYSFLFGLIPLVGGLVGMLKAKLWGGMKSTMGKSVFFISLGLFLWGFGESIWSYYNFFRHVPAPYPSLADTGFAPSIFFWIIGIIFLAKASGAFFALRKNTWAKVLVVLLPILLLVPSYYIQVKLARGGTLVPPGEGALKLVLDIAYPMGDFLALLFAAGVFILSYKYFGGLYRKAIITILLGLAMMYSADTIFSYTTTKGTYYNADWGDFMLTIGVFLLTFGVLAFATKPSVKKESAPPAADNTEKT